MVYAAKTSAEIRTVGKAEKARRHGSSAPPDVALQAQSPCTAGLLHTSAAPPRPPRWHYYPAVDARNRARRIWQDAVGVGVDRQLCAAHRVAFARRIRS